MEKDPVRKISRRQAIKEIALLGFFPYDLIKNLAVEELESSASDEIHIKIVMPTDASFPNEVSASMFVSDIDEETLIKITNDNLLSVAIIEHALTDARIVEALLLGNISPKKKAEIAMIIKHSANEIRRKLTQTNNQDVSLEV